MILFGASMTLSKGMLLCLGIVCQGYVYQLLLLLKHNLNLMALVHQPACGVVLARVVTCWD